MGLAHGLDGFGVKLVREGLRVLKQWNTTFLFRRICRRTACSIKPAETKLLRDAM
jgi:hypothetical protein